MFQSAFPHYNSTNLHNNVIAKHFSRICFSTLEKNWSYIPNNKVPTIFSNQFAIGAWKALPSATRITRDKVSGYKYISMPLPGRQYLVFSNGPKATFCLIILGVANKLLRIKNSFYLFYLLNLHTYLNQ